MKSRCYFHTRNNFNEKRITVSKTKITRILVKFCQKPRQFSSKIDIVDLRISPVKFFKMDSADFWQQARTPFGIQTALQQYSLPSNQPHIQQKLSDVHLEDKDMLCGSSANNPPPLPILNQESNCTSGHILQKQVDSQTLNSESLRGSQQPSDHPSAQLSNHQMLLSAAAAAAAAVHLKSTSIQKNLTSLGDQTIPNTPRSTIGVIKSKQDLELKTTTHHSLESSRQQNTQSQLQPAYGADFFNIGCGAASEATEDVSITMGVGTSKSQSNPRVQIESMGGMQPPHCQPLSPVQGRVSELVTNSGIGIGGLNKTLSQGHQSPQHSVSTSGGSSTPEIKYNNEKMANEIQVLKIFMILSLYYLNKKMIFYF